MTNTKKTQATKILKGALLFTLLTVATACSGGGGQSPEMNSSISGNTSTPSVDGNTSTPSVMQASLRMDLCDEVNGWENDCRFVGMKFIEQNPEEIIPLTEKHGRGRGRGRGGRDA